MKLTLDTVSRFHHSNLWCGVFGPCTLIHLSSQSLVITYDTSRNSWDWELCINASARCRILQIQAANERGAYHSKYREIWVRSHPNCSCIRCCKEENRKDLNDAIFEPPNLVKKFVQLDKSGVIVSPGPVLDGVAKHITDIIEPIDTGNVDEVIKVLKKSRTEILVNLLPVGSQNATEAYAEAALASRCAFINAIPVFVASGKAGNYGDKFAKAGLPLVGDDMKGQLGATVLHRALAALCRDRGIKIDDSYQLNIGGNADFLNMLDGSRLESKRISKTSAVKSVITSGQELADGSLRIGPSDYVEFLGNKKIAYLHIKGRGFASQPVSIEVKLEVEDR